MKKQLLSIAMLVSLFAVGNAFAAGPDEEGVPNGGAGEPTPTVQTPPVDPAPVVAPVDPTADDAKKDEGNGFFAKSWGYAKSPFAWVWTNKKGVTVGAAITVAAKLVYDNFDKIVGKSAEDDVEDEDDDNEDEDGE